MYKVFIADDEEFVVKSLMKGTRWEEYGFEAVASAKDGIEAYEAICKAKPHLVFTDIRMPGMSGLELIKNIQKVHKDILFVVISGYAEFAYAQKAIDYGAIGYCLKPFDEDEISSLLKKARSILEKTAEDDRDALSLLEEDNSETVGKLEDFLKKNGIDVEKGIVIIASIGSKQLVFPNELKYIKVKTGSYKYVYILENSAFLEVEQAMGDRVPDEIKGVGICEGIYSTVHLRKYVDEAFTSAYQFFITGKRGVYRSIHVNHRSMENLIDKFESDVARMDIGEVIKVFDSIRDTAENGACTIKHAVNIYNAYVKISSRVLGEESYEEYAYSFEDLCYLFKDIHAMLEYIRSKITGFVGIKKSVLKEDVKNEYFKKIIQHINQNFYKEISILSLSQDFSINPNYISQLFRKEVGMTFTDYITNLRMDYAKELLHKTQYSQGEVASKCGYTDYFYFIRVFKKTTGLTPGQFRQKGNHKN